MVSMKVLAISTMFIIGSVACIAQANISGSGNWDDPTRWTSGNIGDMLSENVTMANSRDITVRNGFSYTIGNFTAGNNDVITIQATGVLNIGDAANPRNFTVPNGLNLTVIGTLHIFGNLIVSNNLTVSVSGTLIIDGDVQLNNNASLSVTSGSISVGGNFTGGNNTAISITDPGAIDVAGDFSVGNGSTLGGDGTLSVGGNCAGPICTDPQLPVTLLYFVGAVKDNLVKLEWSTSSELNFDFFLLEKSFDGLNFFELSRIKGHGTSFERKDYAYKDFELPFERSYYRLTSVDFDGFREVFDIVAVSYKGLASVAVYPNPVINTVYVDFNFDPQEEVQIIITNLTGNSVASFNTTKRKSQLDLQLGSGVYLLRISSNEVRTVKRLTVE